jgi:hypothetical protein
MLTGSRDLRRLAADGARLAIAFDYHNALMPFYEAVDQYDLRSIWRKEDVDRGLIEYASVLLGRRGHTG